MSPTSSVDLTTAITYKVLTVMGLRIAYREAGDPKSQVGAAAWFSGVIAPISQLGPRAGRSLSRHRARLPRLWR